MTFDPEYREYVAKLVVEDRKEVATACRELELSNTTVNPLGGEVSREIGPEEPGALSDPEELEQAEKQLLKENARLKEENEILKKAMHIFTQGPQ